MIAGLCLLGVLALSGCGKGSNVNSDAQAYCKTHYPTQDVCETDDRCKWNAEKSVCKEK